MILLLALALQDPDALIVQLGSDNPGERDAAEVRLRELGVDALDALMARRGDDDPERRARVRGLLSEIVPQAGFDWVDRGGIVATVYLLAEG